MLRAAFSSPAFAYPNFGSQKQFLSWNAAFADGFAHAFLIIISLSRIDRAISGFQGFRYILLTFRGSNLPDAVAQQGHFDTFVESYLVPIHCLFVYVANLHGLLRKEVT